MSYESINSSKIAAGKAVTNELMTTIKDNLDDHESRIQAVSASGDVSIFNQILQYSELPIGSMIWSADTLANAQKRGLSSNWIRPEGSGTWVDGNGDTNNIIDLRNRFIRMVNTDVIDTSVYTDTTAKNGLSMGTAGNHSHTYTVRDDDSSSSYFTVTKNYTGGATSNMNTNAAGNHSHSLSGDSETAPIHGKINLFFKKEYSYCEEKLLFKASYALTLNSISLMQFEAGTNGSELEIDVKVGTITDMRAGTMTSVFTTKPKVTSDGSTEYVEATNTVLGSNTAVALGEYIELSVSSKQTGSNGFHVQLSGVK